MKEHAHNHKHTHKKELGTERFGKRKNPKQNTPPGHTSFAYPGIPRQHPSTLGTSELLLLLNKFAENVPDIPLFRVGFCRFRCILPVRFRLFQKPSHNSGKFTEYRTIPCRIPDHIHRNALDPADKNSAARCAAADHAVNVRGIRFPSKFRLPLTILFNTESPIPAESQPAFTKRAVRPSIAVHTGQALRERNPVFFYQGFHRIRHITVHRALPGFLRIRHCLRLFVLRHKPNKKSAEKR